MIKFGIIGYGNIGKIHAEAITSNPRCTLSWVCSKEEKLKIHNQNVRLIGLNDVEDYLQNVDCCVVSTPTEKHFETSIKILKANKHILLEKPCCLNSKELDVLLRINRRYILPGYHRQYHPAVLRLKEIIEKSEYGRLGAYSGIWSTHKPDTYFLKNKNKLGIKLSFKILLIQIYSMLVVSFSTLTKIYYRCKVNIEPVMRGLKREIQIG